MSETGVVAVYVRNSLVYVAPQAGGPTGLRLDIEPVIVTNLEVGALAEGLRQAFEHTSPLPSPVPDLRRYRSPVLSAAGVKSAGQFENGLRYATVAPTPDAHEIQPFARGPEGRGFVPKGEPLRIADGPGLLRVAHELVRVLRAPADSPRTADE